MSAILPINIEALLRARGIESARVEFKENWNEDVTALQVLQTICAFANDFQNLNGGYIVIGIRARDGAAEFPPAGLDPGTLDKMQIWLRGRCNTLDPPYQPILSPEVVEGRHILVIWAPGSDTRPHQAPLSLEKGNTTKQFFVRLGAETVAAKKQVLTQLLQLTARVPFDDRRALDVPIEKLRETSVREFLSDVGSRLLEERDAREIFRRMLITARVNGHEVPRNVGLLFFSDDPAEWFRSAFIEVASFGDAPGNIIEERTFRGPLPHQLRLALNYLNSFSIRHLEKLDDRPEVRRWESFPSGAIEESLVNAVYHRGYEDQPEPVKVYLYPDRIEIISYPGPVPGLERSHFQKGSRVPPVPARNRRIGELLKELRLAESRGTGIPKIYEQMARNGSPDPQFSFDDTRTYFQVTLPAHPEYKVR